MKVEVLSSAEEDLWTGYLFYERQQRGLGSDFIEFMQKEIARLPSHAGQHLVVFGGYHRAVVRRRFPFAIYYTKAEEAGQVHGVLDCRSDPSAVAERYG